MEVMFSKGTKAAVAQVRVTFIVNSTIKMTLHYSQTLENKLLLNIKCKSGI